MNSTNWSEHNKSGHSLYPLWSKIIFKATGAKGVVTRHGYSKNGGYPMIGIKTNEDFGQALDYNRTVFASEIEHIN